MLVNVLQGMDNGGYYFFRHKAQHYPDLVPVMQVGNVLGGTVFIVVLAVLAVLLFMSRRQGRAAVVTAAGLLAGVVLADVVSSLVSARRPEDAQNLVDADQMFNSFPARSVFLFTLAGILFLYAIGPSLTGRLHRALMTACVVVLILWVCMSQLFLGLHFVTDVMAGLAGGVALGLLCGRLMPRARPDPDRAGPGGPLAHDNIH
jgi:membrane-associated phospholipid phosphatase